MEQLPTFVFFQNSTVVDRLEGSNEITLRQKIEDLVGDAGREAVEHAEQSTPRTAAHIANEDGDGVEDGATLSPDDDQLQAQHEDDPKGAEGGEQEDTKESAVGNNVSESGE